MQRFRIAAIVGVVVFALASVALSIVAIWTTIFNAGNNWYYAGIALSTLAAIGCGFAMRRSAQLPERAERSATNKLGLRP